MKEIYNKTYTIKKLLKLFDRKSIGSKKPSLYLSHLKQRKHFAIVMKSHLIPYDQNSGLWSSSIKKGYKIFLGQRASVIAKAFESMAGIKLFRKE